MGWIDKLKKRWNLKNAKQVFLVLLVFAATGFTVLLVKKPLFDWLGPEVQQTTIFHVLYYILILPVYNLILLFYGLLVGQFRFFWEFEKRMVKRIFDRKSP